MADTFLVKLIRCTKLCWLFPPLNLHFSDADWMGMHTRSHGVYRKLTKVNPIYNQTAEGFRRVDSIILTNVSEKRFCFAGL